MKLFIEKIYSKVSPLRLWRETGTRPRKKDSEGTSREKRGDVDDAALRRTAADLAQASDSALAALAALESPARPPALLFLLLPVTATDRGRPIRLRPHSHDDDSRHRRRNMNGAASERFARVISAGLT